MCFFYALFHELRQNSPFQNEQSQDVVVLDSGSGSPEQLAALHKNQKSSPSNSCFIAKEENNGPSVTPKENCTSSNPSTELEVKKASSSETVKLHEALFLHALTYLNI